MENQFGNTAGLLNCQEGTLKDETNIFFNELSDSFLNKIGFMPINNPSPGLWFKHEHLQIYICITKEKVAFITKWKSEQNAEYCDVNKNSFIVRLKEIMERKIYWLNYDLEKWKDGKAVLDNITKND